MEKKNSFILYTDYMEYFEMLSPTEQSSLIMAIFAYQKNGDEPTSLTPTANMAFRFIKDQLDRDREKYEKICEKNRENVMKRYNKSTTVYHNDTETENENYTDTVTDTDNDGSAVKGGVGRRPSGTAGSPRSGRERKRKKEEEKGSFDTDEFFEAALARAYAITSGK